MSGMRRILAATPRFAGMATPRSPHRSGPSRLATLTGLSTSRFLHLFRQHTGTSLRRHRTWLRMMSVVRGIRGGADLSTAAMDAGFAGCDRFVWPRVTGISGPDSGSPGWL